MTLITANEIKQLNKNYCNNNDIDYRDIILLIFSDNFDINLLNLTDSVIINILGLYFNKNKNYDEMVKYYLIGIELKCCISMNKLAGYYFLINNFELMIKYYLMSIELNNVTAMLKLGDYYNVEKKYDLMKKYYIMAIDLNNSTAMFKLGYYYQDIDVNIGLMEKYYLMAADQHNLSACNNIGFYYSNKIENHELAKKYYMMAIKLNCTVSMFNLAFHYTEIEKKYDLVEKYYLMAIALNDIPSMHNLAQCYHMIFDTKNDNLAIKYYTMAIELNYKKSLVNLELYFNDDIEFFKFLINLKKTKIITDKISALKSIFKAYMIKCKLLNNLNNSSMLLFTNYLYNLYVQHNIKNDDGYKTDFVLNISYNNEIKIYYVHSFVLNFEYFRILIDGNFNKQTMMNINVLHSDTAYDFIKFLYTNEFDVDYDNLNYDRIHSLFVLADNYGINCLSDFCKNLLHII